MNYLPVELAQALLSDSPWVRTRAAETLAGLVPALERRGALAEFKRDLVTLAGQTDDESRKTEIDQIVHLLG